jgi:alkanesulfonate monooxygenase SsuD/methylene tetrahydromethanopterin reductase-like flavin-dependent oxidoreductase (luciferase family)
VNDDGTVDAWERTGEAIARKVEWMRQAAGKRFATVELNLLIGDVVITEDRQQAAERRARESGRSGVTAERLLASPYLLIGSIEQIAERIQRLRERYGISYLVVGSEDMESFAPVIARLANT